MAGEPTLQLISPAEVDASVRATHAGIMPERARWRVDAALIGPGSRTPESIRFIRTNSEVPGSDPRGPLFVLVTVDESGERMAFRISLEEES